MSKKLKLHIGESELLFGKQFTFKAPCDPGEINSLQICGTTYWLCDALGNRLCDKSDAWKKDAFVSVILDTEHNKAFVLNSPKSLGTYPEDIGAVSKTGDTVEGDLTVNGDLVVEGPTGLTVANQLGVIGGATVNGGMTLGKGLTLGGAIDIGDISTTRKNLGIITGSYTGNGGSQTLELPLSSSEGLKADAKNCSIIMIWSVGAGSRAFLTPSGGMGFGNTDIGGTERYSNNSGDIAYFEKGTLYLRCNSFAINSSGKTYYYLCI